MTMNQFEPGVNTSFSTELNSNYNRILTILGLNTIRQLIDRAGIWSAGNIDGWGEAYIDISGRENSVDSDLTTSFYDSASTSYIHGLTDEASGDSTYDPDSFTNASNVFDGDKATYATKGVSGTSDISIQIGKTFSAKNVDYVYYRIQDVGGTAGGGSEYDYGIYLETYNGSTWDIQETIDSGTQDSNAHDRTFDSYFRVNSSVQGVRLRFFYDYTGDNRSTTFRVYDLRYGDQAAGDIYHDIPSGTFSSTISSSFGTPLIEDWETGASVEYKLTGSSGAEDTGWLSSNEISEFTAFTAEPDTLTIRLSPKSTSPTAGYPSIKGFWVRAE